jgi:hypothetical protein
MNNYRSVGLTASKRAKENERKCAPRLRLIMFGYINYALLKNHYWITVWVGDEPRCPGRGGDVFSRAAAAHVALRKITHNYFTAILLASRVSCSVTLDPWEFKFNSQSVAVWGKRLLLLLLMMTSERTSERNHIAQNSALTKWITRRGVLGSAHECVIMKCNFGAKGNLFRIYS